MIKLLIAPMLFFIFRNAIITSRRLLIVPEILAILLDVLTPVTAPSSWVKFIQLVKSLLNIWHPIF